MTAQKQNELSTARPSRRVFLKASTAFVAGGLALQRSAHAAGDDLIRIGLIGCGGRGSGAAVNAMNADPQVRLVAMADLFPDKVQASRQTLKKARPEQVDVADDRCFSGFDGYRHVLESGVDVVLIACTSRFHPQYLEAAVAAGKHIFIEKPHAIDPPGIKRVIAACEAARQKGLTVVSGLCWRYHTGVRETMKRVLDGAIGDIVAIQETYMRSPYRLIQRKPEWSETEYQFRNWYHFNWLSGDDIAQSLIHSMDKGAWAMRDEPPLWAYGQGGRAASFGSVYGDVFDHQSVVYEYPNGVRMYAVGRAQTGCYGEVSDIFLGTKGRCDLLKFRIEGETNWEYKGPKCNMYDEEHKALFAAIRSGTPINNGTYMVRSSMLAILGQIVCYTGEKVTWDDATKMTYQLGPDECSLDMDPPVHPDDKGIYPVPVPGQTRLT